MKNKKLLISITIVVSLFFTSYYYLFYLENNQIKLITEVEYEPEFSATKTKQQNPRIKLITKTSYDKNGNLRKKCFYDNNQKKIKENVYLFIDGQLIKSNENNRTKIYKYDSKGKLIYIKHQNEYILEKMSYDDKAQLIQKLEISSNNDVISKTRYSYENGQIVKELIEFDGNKELNVYEYDKNGRMISKFWIDSLLGPIEKTYFSYDGDKLQKEEWQNYEDGKIEGTVIYIYENNLEKEVFETDIEDSSEVKWKYTYLFDSQNNWIKRTEIFDQNKITITERLIEYF